MRRTAQVGATALSSQVPNTWLAIDGEPSGREEASAVWTGSEVLVWGGTGNTGTNFNDGALLDPVTSKWTAITTVGAPTARINQTTVWTGTQMIVWGGCCDSSGALGDGARYNPATDTWSSVSTTGAPAARFGHTAVWTGTEMIVWGGGNSQGAAFGDGARYNPATNTWTPLPTSGAPPASSGASAVWTGTEMLVWGGATGNLFSSTGARYNPATNTWAPLATTNAPGPRAQAATVWTGTEMLIWGGIGQVGGPGFTNVVGDGAAYNPSTDTWRTIASQGAPSARMNSGVVWTGNEMLVWGGNTVTTTVGGGARYAPAVDAWTPIPTQGGPGPRTQFTAVWTGLDLIAWGGLSTGTSAVTSGFRYRPSTSTWSQLSQIPSQRSFHTAVWTGTQMIVWGGQGAPFGQIGDGAAYSPTTDTWSSISQQGAPGPRSSHTAVWTGTEMIVWGGIGGSAGNTFLGDGARYNPATDSWKPISSQGAPSARAGHTAVWTGTEMIIWGGSSDPGARYNPATDTWRPVATLLFFDSNRTGHSAVWTGSKMIVWGGCCTGDGASYDPVSDSWTRLSSQGAPSPRFGHSGIWTGAQMVIWGGSTAAATSLGDGARYDPSIDSWTTTSSVGAPMARSGHTAAWTGSQMLIWGGSNQGQPLGDGAAYRPDLDKWQSLASLSAPAARMGHSVVWTGAEMIVWGGSNATGSQFNDGGRLTPPIATTSASPMQFYPLPSPVRLLDTRSYASNPACDSSRGQLAAGSVRLQSAAGICGIPASAQAIFGNVTPTGSQQAGYITLFPSTALSVPTVSNVNYAAGQTLNNAFVVGLGGDGKFKLLAGAQTDLVIDVTGYFAPPATGGMYFHRLPSPVRLLDTRNVSGLVGCDVPRQSLASGQIKVESAAGPSTTSCTGVPVGANALVGNVTPTGSVAPGYITLFPANASSPPIVSNVNYGAQETINNSFTVALDGSGAFKILAGSATDLVIDVSGYYDSNAAGGQEFLPLPTPVRLLDTRDLPGLVGCDVRSGILPTGGVRTEPAVGSCTGVPSGASAIFGNVTSTGSTAGGYVTLFPNSGGPPPIVSNLNYSAGETINDAFTVGLGPDGAFNILSGSQTNLVIDISGSFVPAGP